MDDWPFDQPRNGAAISLRQIVFENQPILHVTHDEDDHGWQFLGIEDVDAADAVVVCMAEILEKDSSLRLVADLPPGWHAWRKDKESPWEREIDPSEPSKESSQ